MLLAMNFESLPLHLQSLVLYSYYAVRAIILVSLFFYFYQTAYGQKKKIASKKYETKQIKFEAIQTSKVFALDTVLLLLFLNLGWLKLSTGTIAFATFCFIVLFFWTEIWFYVFHRFFHLKVFWTFHKTHHQSKIPSPLSAFTFSLTERLTLFMSTISLLAIASYFGMPFSALGVQSYFGVNVFLSVLGHSDLKINLKSWQNLGLLKYWSVPADHSLHHSKPRCNYGLFTTYLDQKLGTYERPEL
jgi:Delta7-sterol 5-desaturase